jgi:pilus assembly protein Flp/PilA
MNRLIALLKDSRGATSSEYAIMAALVAGVVVAAVTSLGVSVDNLYQTVTAIFP